MKHDRSERIVHALSPTKDDIAEAEKSSWEEIFADLRAAEIPHDFFGERDQGVFEAREELDAGPHAEDTHDHLTALPPEEPRTAKVFMSGRSQAVRIPAAFRFSKKEVSIRRDPQTGDLILSEKPDWKAIFAALDAAQIPHDFLGDRDQGLPQVREEF